MGQLKRQVLGDASGAVGHLVFRIKGKKNIIANRPVKKVPAPIPTAVVSARREKFSLTGKAARAVNKVNELKQIWPVPSEGSRFNEMFQKTYKTIGTIDNLGEVRLIPDEGIPLSNPLITLTQKGMTIAADQLGASANIDASTEKYLVAAGVVVLKTPTKADQEPYKVLSILSGKLSLADDAPISMNVEFAGGLLGQYQAYTEKKVYITFVTLKDDGTAVQFTGQFNN